MIKIGIIGCGYWGPNLVRNFMDLTSCEVVAISDLNSDRLVSIGARYPQVARYSDYKDILKNPEITGVVISTNLITHYKIAKDALNAGKHIMLEKPVASSIDESTELVELAKKKKLMFMSGHTFMYNQGVIDMKKYVEKGALGNIFYLHSERTNLGPIRNDTNALWDLAPHDISIFIYILGKMPIAVSAHGGSFLKKGREDVVFLTMKFAEGILGSLHVSWLDPCKVRKITVIGDKKMLLFDDLNTLEPIRLFDKGVESPKEYGSYGEFQHILRDGDILVPKIKMSEPLKSECAAFLKCIETGNAPVSDGQFGKDVVRVLSAAQASLQNNGVFTEVP